MNLDLKNYTKAKYAPTLFLMEAIQEAKKEIFEMLAEKVLAEMGTWGTNYQEEMQGVINDFKKTIAKGDKGDPPDRKELEELILTLTPYFKGDSPTKEELLSLIIPLIPSKPIAGIDFDLPKDGKTPTEAELKQIIKPMIPPPIPGSPDKPEQIAKKLNTLKEEVNPEVLRGWKKLQQQLKNLSSSTREKKNFGGHGGDATGITVETPTGSVNQVNTSFTVTATPKWIVSDGIVYFSGAGYSIVGLTVTMDVAPSFSIRAFI